MESFFCLTRFNKIDLAGRFTIPYIWIRLETTAIGSESFFHPSDYYLIDGKKIYSINENKLTYARQATKEECLNDIARYKDDYKNIQNIEIVPSDSDSENKIGVDLKNFIVDMIVTIEKNQNKGPSEIKVTPGGKSNLKIKNTKRYGKLKKTKRNRKIKRTKRNRKISIINLGDF